MTHERSATKGRVTETFIGVHPLWIGAQRLGALAWAILQADPRESAQADARARRLQEQFVLEARKLGLKGDPIKAESRIEGLPLSTLALCAKPLLQDRMPAQRPLLRQLAYAFAWQTGRGVASHKDSWGKITEIERCSPADGAEIIAQMMLFSDLPGLSVASALKFFLDQSYEALLASKESKGDLQILLNELRNPTKKASQVIGTVNRICSFLLKFSRTAYVLRNAVFDAVFFWPLLVYQKEERRLASGTGYGSTSFPVLIDVDFDGKEKAGTGVQILLLEHMSFAKRSALVEQIGNAFSTAKGLWRAKNGYARDRWDEVRNATCTVDFRLAQKICEGIGINPIWNDWSAEGYFVQAFLTRLIGRTVSLNVAISGKLTDPVRIKARKKTSIRLPVNFSVDTDDAQAAAEFIQARSVAERLRGNELDEGNSFVSSDRWMGPVGGASEKYRFAAESGKYSKLVLHPRNELSDKDVSDAPYLEVNYVQTMSAAADAVQLGGWRPFRYLRCPDIGHLVHRDPDLLPNRAHPLVTPTTQALSEARDAIIELDSGHSILSVIARLREVNFEVRPELSPTPPALSWSIVRTESNETNLRFWHTFLKAIGASDLAIWKHFANQSDEYTVGLIESILNHDKKAEQLGCTSPPDLVVIFNTKDASRASAGLDEVARMPLDFSSVVDGLKSRLIQPLRGGFQRHLGRMRVILIEEDVTYRNRSYFGALVDHASDAVDVLEKLSVFDWGFTVQLARLVCGDTFLDTNHAKVALERMVRDGVLWKYGQEYFVPHALRADRVLSGLEDARSLKRIGNALMPGIGSDHTSGYSVAECLDVERTREAGRYLRRARDAALKVPSLDGAVSKDSKNLVRQIGLEQELHARFFEMPTWGVVNRLVRGTFALSREDIYSYAEDLISRSAKSVDGILSSAYTITASAARGAMIERFESRDYSGVFDIRSRIDELFDLAEKSANREESEGHRLDWLLNALTWKAEYLMDLPRVKSGKILKLVGGWRQEDWDNTRSRILEICQLDEVYGVSPSPIALNRIGDEMEDVEIAKQVYFRSVVLVPRFWATYPRLFGVADRAQIGSLLSVGKGQIYWRQCIAEALAWLGGNPKNVMDRDASEEVQRRVALGVDRMKKFVK